eukprot:2615266-Prymnesium_polylepis.1
MELELLSASELKSMGLSFRKQAKSEIPKELFVYKLKEALRKGDHGPITKWLREVGQDGLEAGPHLPNGVWVLTAAAGYGHEDVVRKLLKARATPDPPSDDR